MFLIVLAGFGSAQTIIEQHGKFGLLDEKGDTVLSAAFDSITSPLSGAELYAVQKGDKHGYILRARKGEQAMTWVQSELIYNEIYITASGTKRKAYYEYLILRSPQGVQYVAMVVDHHLTTGMFENKNVAGIDFSYASEVVYDSLFRSRNFDGFYGDLVLLKDGKYGMHLDANFLLPTEFDRPVAWIPHSQYISVWKGGLNGIYYAGKMAIPAAFKENELEYRGGAVFEVEAPGQQMQYFNLDEDVGVAITLDGKPFVAIDSIIFTNHVETLDGDSIPTLICVGRRNYYSEEMRSDQDPRGKRLGPGTQYILFVDKTTGEVIQAYIDSDAKYAYDWGTRVGKYIAEFKPNPNSKRTTDVTIYESKTRKVVYQYTVGRVRHNYEFAGIFNVDNKYYELRYGRRTWYRLNANKVRRYIDYETLEVSRSKKKFK
jgi:hypothetical protein